jgi:hypothetical protein
MGDLLHVYRLAQSLLFSLLYGAEFLGCTDVVRRCEAFWWKGVRQFYGLPNGVSGVTLHLLFPRFSLVHKVFAQKVNLMLRGLNPLPTLLPEALIYDRGTLFAEHRVGFTQSVKDWGQEMGLESESVHLCTDKNRVSGLLETRRLRDLDSVWEQFARMASSKSIVTLLGNRENFFQAALTASRFSKLGVRVFILAVTGCLAQSYIKTRTCPPCGEKYDFDHFLSCPALGDPIYLALSQACQRKDWDCFVEVLFLRYHVFLHYFRGGEFDDEESDLFARVVHKEQGK